MDHNIFIMYDSLLQQVTDTITMNAMKRVLIVTLSMILVSVSSLYCQDTSSFGDADPSALDSRTAIEQVYDDLQIEEAQGLEQFGYDLIRSGSMKRSYLVDDSYVLAPGDELRVYFWGDSVEFGAIEPYFETTVDLEGKVFLGPVGRVSAHGLTIGDLEQVISDRVNSRYTNIQTDVSPAAVRSFPVFVSGFVHQPGTVEVNALWTVTEALSLAGGPSYEGSLRNIQIWRGNERIQVDLYDLFLGGKTIDVTMKEGDVIYVPPIGTTAAAAGHVKRPGIYEMNGSESVQTLLSFAGGLKISNAAISLRLIRQNGTSITISESSSSTDGLSSAQVRDGDLLLLSVGNAYRSNMVRIDGAVLYPGIYDLDDTSTLSGLLSRAGIRYDADMAFGTVLREGADDDSPAVVFSPRQILEGSQEDISLKANDLIQLYVREPSFNKEPVKLTGSIQSPGVLPYEEGMGLLDLLKDVRFTRDMKDLQVRIIREGEVVEQVYLYDLLVRGSLEANVEILPGDMAAVIENEESEAVRGVQVLGHVNTPGTYAMEKNMRLSDAVGLAGGFTEQAYPQAIYLIRQSVKADQIEHIRRTIAATREELESVEASLALQADLSADEKNVVKAQIAQQKVLLEQAAEKDGQLLGRIALDIPSSLEQLRGSEDDIILQEGDYIFVPQRSEYVTVIGDVDSAIALPWKNTKSVKDYLYDLGGLRPRDYTISIIKHNGKVVTEDNLFYGWSTIEGQNLDPGDVVIAVRKIDIPAGTKILSVLSDLTDVVYKVVYTLDTLSYFD
jgi:protein involved in polysaccharide export with SLBB domain